MSRPEIILPLESIPVFFSPQMQAQVFSVSPSAHKPQAVLESWQALNIPLEIMEPTRVSIEDIQRAHAAGYVVGILSCRIDNGFYTKDPQVAASLPFTSGAMLSAAREAIRNRRVAVAPCSGFHHASYASNRGFCTFNGLMITALALRAEGVVRRVGILDFDQHYGDGTEDIIQSLALDFVTHFTADKHYSAASQAPEFLQRIPQLVASMRDCEVILYQAGARPPRGRSARWVAHHRTARRARSHRIREREGSWNSGGLELGGRLPESAAQGSRYSRQHFACGGPRLSL
jgi:hypothetical protein